MPFSTHAFTPRVIKVGYSDGYGILQAPGDTRISGYTYDYLKKIAQYTCWQYQFIPGTWSENLERLKNGEIDLLGPAQKTEDRLEIFEYPNYPAGYEYSALFIRADNQSLFYNDFAAFDGMKVGIVPNNFHNTAFEELRHEHGFEVKYVEFSNPSQMITALAAGTVDSIVHSSLADQKNLKLIARFGVAPFYMVTGKGNTNVLDALNSALEAIRNDDIYFDAWLNRRHFMQASTSVPTFTRAEKDFIETKPLLRLGYLKQGSPFEFLEDGKFTGINADILSNISQFSGLRFTPVALENYEQAEKALLAGSIDLVSGVSGKLLADSHMEIRAGENFLQVPMAFISKKGSKLSEKITIALSRTYGSMKDSAVKHFAQAEVLILPSIPDSVEAVRSGKAQVALVNSFFYDWLNTFPEYKDMELLFGTSIRHDMALAISAQQPATLLSVLNKAQSRVSQWQINESIFTNTGNKGIQATTLQIWQRFFIPLMFILILGLIAGGAFYLRSRRKAQQQLWRMAYVDELTGYENWNKFEQDAPALLTKGKYACVVADIDNFKLINEYFGYTTGSLTLQRLADTIAAHLEKGELFARRDGDIFVILLRFEVAEDLFGRVNSMQQSMSASSGSPDDEGRFINIASGVYIIDDPLMSFSSIFDRANVARKSTKPLLGNACNVFDSSMSRRYQEEQEIELQMDQALRNGEFLIYLQPKYDLHHNNFYGAEALVRWASPRRGLLSPAVFIPLFERNAFILKLDMYVLELVCKRLRLWIDNGLEVSPIAVNISKVHLHTARFIPLLQSIVEKYAIAPNLIEIELTETVFFGNTSKLLDTIIELSKLGFTLAMDDFGSGYSSLNMLKDIPVQVLKLDRGFFDMGDMSSRGKPVIAGIIQMAKSLDMRVVSEGVENLAQIEFLRENGCDYIQSYYFARPMPVEEYELKYYGKVQTPA